MKENPENYRAVVIGCGRIGSEYSFQTKAPGVHSHAQAYYEHPRIDLVGVSDLQEAPLQRARTHWQTEGEYDAIALCVRLQPDIVSLCTPDPTHASLALEILRAAPPKVMLIEKPLARRSEEALAVVEEARRAGTAVAVNFSRRYTPIYALLKKELMSGIHGKPLRARVFYSKGLAHAGSHALDILRYWLGDPTEVVKRRFSAWGPEGDETLSADLLFPGGVVASLDAFDERHASLFEIDILTEKSRWMLRNGGVEWRFFEARHGEPFPEYTEYLPTLREEHEPALRDERGALYYATENIVQHLACQEPLVSSGEEGLATLELVERIRNA